ncbi:glycosyl transferase family 41 [Ciceribacter lividus]|uniref:Glycosyl transferase family 41 n=1 Tax=Ciceribacter lividus TaxID=1197950 RepID=A0A6I7HII6_9HYPH|nr:glycosyl transferase [Ciceribacter lividus]RCW21561.1 glycosyl transferase family 41 [Ciceribacter lividus]
MTEAFSQAVREFEAGRFRSALAKAGEALAASAGEEDASLLRLIGDIRLKMGERIEAADAFVRAADASDTPAAAQCLKRAVTLYAAEGATDRILPVGARAASLNPDDSELAFAVASAFFSRGRLHDMEPLLDRLDRRIDRHLALVVNHHRLTGRFEELCRELDEGLKASPWNWFLNTSRFAVAHEALDFAAMARHEALMKEPDAPFSAGLLARERALTRLIWSEDEALNARPSLETAGYAVTLPTAGHGKRRPFSPPGEKIRIGYLSNDFYCHPMMTLFLRTMASHDPERFELRLFSYTEPHAAAKQEEWPEHLRRAVIPVGELSDAAAAKRIDAERIDILVDLKGHTMGARLGIVNLCGAPVKATYLGYPGSVTGVDLDYAITDPVVTPDTSKPFYGEKLCRLPETYQANDWQARPLPAFMEREDAGLPEDAFVFGAFNAPYKITPRTLSLWAEVLRAVPDAVLWVLCPLPLARRNLLAALETSGVARHRVFFAERKAGAAHIDRLPLADLGLDTLPFNGGATTADLLWAGLPLLTVRGRSFAARTSASLLLAAGLPELVAEDDGVFVDTAVMLARDPFALTGLRQRLDASRFVRPLFDGVRFTRHLEHAYEMMAARARAGLPPDHIDVPADPPRTTPFRAP